MVACVVGDGEAETGPAATGWHSNKFLDPRRDGAVLPILHLNGYKIAAPTVLARIPTPELLALFTGYGYHPVLVEGGFDGESPMAVHRRMAAALDDVFAEIADIQDAARLARRHGPRPAWPMLILRTPKGWTGPKVVDGLPIEGTFRAHQLPLAEVRTNPEHLAQLEAWLRSYRPDELFDADGDADRGHLPASPRRRAAHERQPPRQRRTPPGRPRAARLLATTRSTCRAPGPCMREATRVLGSFLRDVIRANPDTFRLFGPDETVLQPTAGRLRGHRPDLGRRATYPATTTWPPTAG